MAVLCRIDPLSRGRYAVAAGGGFATARSAPGVADGIVRGS